MWGEEAVGEEREKRSGSSKAPLNPRGNGGGVEARRKDEEGEEEKRGGGGGREEGGRQRQPKSEAGAVLCTGNLPHSASSSPACPGGRSSENSCPQKASLGEEEAHRAIGGLPRGYV